MLTASRLGEFGLIDCLRRFQNLSDRVVTGIGDDAAVLAYDKKRFQLLTADMMVEGRHFLRSQAPGQVGHKALASNISDIAAMGGIPRHAVISLGISSRTGVSYVQDLYAGMHRLARKFDVSLVGGDTVASEKVIINIALTGEVEKRNLVLRCGAQAGDIIFVTGPLGNSLKSGRHLTFTPRVDEARFLVRHFKPSAMIDISDGLAGDLGHILRQSHVSALLDGRFIPVHEGASLKQALGDGEDYELVFTLSPANARRLARSQRGNFMFYPIGSVVPGAGQIRLRKHDGKIVAINSRAFTHF